METLLRSVRTLSITNHARRRPVLLVFALWQIGRIAFASTNTALVLPESQPVLLGSNAMLSVVVSGPGPGPFTYQWRLNGTNLPNNVISTVVGNGTNGYSGDGGAAINAELDSPLDVTLDAFGNLFIADEFNFRVRKVNNNGVITTVAGNGTEGYSGDGGAATNAQVRFPFGVVLDSVGNLFIADGVQRVRRVDTNGIITTEAGGGPNNPGDGGAATEAILFDPVAVAVDASRNLFIAEYTGNRIRKVDTNGIITTVAGKGPTGAPGSYSGDGGLATNASLYYPVGVAVDFVGNLFIADGDNNRIRKVATNGIITTVAGGGTNNPGDGGAATNAALNLPSGVAVDASGNLFIVDTLDFRIREVDTHGIITTVAGNGSRGSSGDGGAATSASLNQAYGAAFDVYGNLFIADSENYRVRKVVRQGPSIPLLNVSTNSAGVYDVVVTSPYGSVTSSVATVTVALPPLIAKLQASQVVRLQFSGGPAISYLLMGATNLIPPIMWQPVYTNSADSNGNWSFTNLGASSNPALFYRLRLP